MNEAINLAHRLSMHPAAGLLTCCCDIVTAYLRSFPKYMFAIIIKKLHRLLKWANVGNEYRFVVLHYNAR